jgi:hypothetical protein
LFEQIVDAEFFRQLGRFPHGRHKDRKRETERDELSQRIRELCEKRLLRVFRA